MASVQYGAMITGLKGNVGGQTFQNGNVAKVLRNKGYKKGGTSAARSLQLTRLVTASTSWRSLSGAHRQAWNASAGNWAFKDKFGNTYYGTGYQKYVAESIAFMMIGGYVGTTPDMPTSITAPGPVSVDYSLGAGAFIEITNAAMVNQYLFIFASYPMSVGRNSNNARYRLLSNPNVLGTNSQEFDADYVAVYGAPPLGSKIVVKLQWRTDVFPIIQLTQIVECLVVA